MTLTITHTPTDGTLIAGTDRGDGTAPILKARGWRWSRALGTWYVPRSRDALPKRGIIDATTARLREAGHELEVDLDGTLRPAGVVEAATLDRAQERAAALSAKADTARNRADVAQGRATAAHNRLPDNGQPILVGHHSEAGHRRALQRADNAMRASIDADKTAAEVARRAETTAHTTGSRYNPVTVANRIGRLEAEYRRLVRQRDGYTRTLDADRQVADTFAPATGEHRAALAVRIERLEAEIGLWRCARDQQTADGTTVVYGPENVKAGHHVKIRGRWHEVVRANRKTVTVPSTIGSWTDTAPWQEVTDHNDPTNPATP